MRIHLNIYYQKLIEVEEVLGSFVNYCFIVYTF